MSALALFRIILMVTIYVYIPVHAQVYRKSCYFRLNSTRPVAQIVNPDNETDMCGFPVPKYISANQLYTYEFEGEPNVTLTATCIINIPSKRPGNCLDIGMRVTGRYNNKYPNFLYTQAHCGKTEFTFESTSNRIAMGVYAIFLLKEITQIQFQCVVQPLVDNNVQHCACGMENRNQVAIVGGNETTPNQFPFMAVLIQKMSHNIRVLCGASIISKRYLVTAAHCVKGRSEVSLSILVGMHNITAVRERGYLPTNHTFRVKEYQVHEHFVGETRKYSDDIALIVLHAEIEFGPTVGPICLPYRELDARFENLVGYPVTTVGWGETKLDGPVANVLKFTNLMVVESQLCKNSYRFDDESTKLCTFANGTDSCAGDSGGPVLYYSDVTQCYHLVGVISAGFKCAIYPAVETRVTSYLDWILSNVKDNSLCRI